ncbi:hypothetical protein [Phaeobacter gallaeciensis]|nr:hypothetical protein [Phaeobacter gallaeciensis]
MFRIAVKLENAAKLLELETDEFLEMVRSGDMPMPICLGEHIRWSTESLRQYVSTSPEPLPASIDKLT